MSRPTKHLDDMTEPELRDLTTRCLNAVKDRLPTDTGFVLLFFPFGGPGVSQYGSNCNRSDMITALREAANRLERRQDVTR